MKCLLVVLVLIPLIVKVESAKPKCYACEDGTEFDCMDSLLTVECHMEGQSCVKIIDDDGSVKKGCMHFNDKPHYMEESTCYREKTQTACPCNGDFCNSAKKSEFFIFLPVLVVFALWH
ncbi:hypothetical protein M3Y97_00957400 [Aphelenchoides bicaudatus]|nr:hypothetical protein M3Y97_00957400 [Aphelenchoides bicaudatus]